MMNRRFLRLEARDVLLDPLVAVLSIMVEDEVSLVVLYKLVSDIDATWGERGSHLQHGMDRLEVDLLRHILQVDHIVPILLLICNDLLPADDLRLRHPPPVLEYWTLAKELVELLPRRAQSLLRPVIIQRLELVKVGPDESSDLGSRRDVGEDGGEGSCEGRRVSCEQGLDPSDAL